MATKEDKAARETRQALTLILLRVRGNEERAAARAEEMTRLASRLLEMVAGETGEDIVTRPVKQTFDALEHDRNEVAKILKRIRGNYERSTARRDEMTKLAYRLHEMFSEEVLLGRDVATERAMERLGVDSGLAKESDSPEKKRRAGYQARERIERQAAGKGARKKKRAA